MSYQAVQWALDEAPMLRTSSGKPDTTARSVLVARAERADEHGRDSHASIADIVWRTGYDPRTVQRAEDRLEAAGLLQRDGTTRWGTTRWHLDMTQRRDPVERDELDAAIERRRADNAARERSRRERQRADRTMPAADDDEDRADSASPRGDGNSTRGDSASTHADSGYTRVDAAPPEPPMNHPGTAQETSLEPPSGGTLPPDPLRPHGSTSRGLEKQTSISTDEDQPLEVEGELRPRAREDNAIGAVALRMIEGNPEAEPTGERGMWPAPVTEPARTSPARGTGWCVPCYRQGDYTVATDPIAGDVCAHHARTAAAS